MDEFRLGTAALVTLLMIGMGPIRVSLAFLPVLRPLAPEQRVVLVRRTVVAGGWVVVIVTLFGGALVRNFSPRLDAMRISIGLVVVVTTLAALVQRPTPPPADATPPDLIAMSISPLAVPAMIGPVGFAILFAEAAYVADRGNVLRFVALVIGILVLDFVVLRLLVNVAERVSRPILLAIQYPLNLLTVALGVQMILLGCAGYGLIQLT